VGTGDLGAGFGERHPPPDQGELVDKCHPPVPLPVTSKLFVPVAKGSTTSDAGKG
jgi:hypothetical protein